MLPESEQELLDGCRAGNRKAQERLYRNYYRSMAGLCVRYISNPEDAMEALNNGFLKVFRHIDRYDPAQGSCYTWIRTIVLHACIDYLKNKKTIDASSELNEDTDVPIAPDIVARMDANELHRLIGTLQPATAAVFNLYVIEGYQHHEIARLLGISEGTSKWHLHAARKQLQLRMQQQNLHYHG